ncbi:MAG: DUF4380 domain-containing protein [Chloroflexota bacterium]|nr:DUF4380 domain-containing protein [Chloroflexota bacterium]
MKSISAIPGCRVEHGEFRGWKAVYLQNGLVTVAAVPDLGGRIMAYDLGEFPYLYVERALAGKLFGAEENLGDGSLAAWKNYGGDKTWPSPQGWDNDEQWHGPPDPILDSGRFQVIDLTSTPDSAAIEMVSPPDPRTGLQITRRLTLHRGSSRLTLDLSFTNISDRRIRWSIWDVVQLRAEHEASDGSLQPDTSCVVTAPLNPASRFPRGFSVMFGSQDNPQWQVEPETGLFVGRYLSEMGKVGIDSSGGWIAFSNERAGYTFAERFTYDPAAVYPDDGATVECWTTGRGVVGNLSFEDSQVFHMETEVLSPLFTFQPGQRRSFRIEWGACRLPGRVVDVQPGGCSFQVLSVQGENGDFRVGGVFGVFDYAELSLVGKDETGNEKYRVSLGSVSPLESATVDSSLPFSLDATVLELQATAVSDRQSRLLASVHLKQG